MTQLAQDTFQRANEFPLSDGGNWTTITNLQPCQVVSDACEASNTVVASADYWSGLVWPNDQYSVITISNIFDGEVYAAARVSASQQTYYWAVASPSGISLQRWVNNSGSTLGSVVGVVSAGDTVQINAQGTTISVLHNGTTLISVTDSMISTGSAGLAIVPLFSTSDTAIALWAGGNFAATTYSISGNAGVAGATVAYSGTATGSFTADGLGNFAILGLANGNYVITPSKSGYSFSPSSHSETVSGSNISGVNFTASSGPAAKNWSPPDCRDYATFPNTGVVQASGAVFYTQPTHPSHSNPQDSRKGGGPTDSRKGGSPENSREAPPFES